MKQVLCIGRTLSAMAALLALSACTTLGVSQIPLLSETGIDSDATVGLPPGDVTPLPDPVTAPPQPRQFREFDLAQAVTAGELRFQSGDSIKVSVWGYPELDHTATVQPNGRVTLPLVGEVDAAGVTVGELRERITERLVPFTTVRTTELRPGDTLTMEVWQHPELRSTAIIEPGGTVTFPLAGSVQVVGRTVESVRKEVEQRLLQHLREVRVTVLPNFINRRVLHDFHVSVLPSRLEPRRVALIGEVNVQGLAEIKGSLRIVDALAQAQLRQMTAALNSVVVIRNPSSGTPQYRMIRLADFFEGRAPDQNIYLQNDDIVIVPRTAIAKIGDYVELFFTRTAPIFYWWSAMWQSTVDRQKAETVGLINDSLKRSLSDLTVTPTVSPTTAR